LILPLQYSTLKLANGQMLQESQILVFNGDSKTPVIADGKNTILTPKVDVSIVGTPKGDKVNGGMGDDTINGLYGRDLLSGQDGNDKINGGMGNDKISGQGGNDMIKGENGNDMLFGGDGYDQLYGDIGDDVLDGGKGYNILVGGSGSDTFICNQYDTVMDFNATVDQRTGSCKIQSQEVIGVSDTKPSNELFQSSTSSKVTPVLPINGNDALPNFEPMLRLNPNSIPPVAFHQTLMPIPVNHDDMQQLQFN
jgi:Ca2+-binding RTX toxin-like protein